MLAEGFSKGKELLSDFPTSEQNWPQWSLKFLLEIKEQEINMSEVFLTVERAWLEAEEEDYSLSAHSLPDLSWVPYYFLICDWEILSPLKSMGIFFKVIY